MKYVVAVMVSVILFGCAEKRADQGEPASSIRVAVLPDQSRDRLLSKYSPLMAYLESATSLEVELSVPLDYSDLLNEFDAGRVDLAWFGGLTFAQAETKNKALPLAFRDIDVQFTSCYLARASDTRTSIAEFAGERFSFGPSLSTSGHLMPRYFMSDEGIEPEELFASIQHSDGHDQTAIRVSNGEVDLGVANCIIVQSMFDSGVLNDEDVRIIETTPPYPDYVWAISPTMDEQTKISLLNAFLALDPTIPEHRAILRSMGANAYFPAGITDFEMVRIAAVQAGVLNQAGEE